jgi:predicted lactoylglutathione lyase
LTIDEPSSGIGKLHSARPADIVVRFFNRGGIPMEQRVGIITLGVADLERSRTFYERLGWRRAMSTSSAEGIVFFQAGGIALALYPRHELANDANVAADGQGFRGITLAYNGRTRMEVDSVLNEAAAAGAKIVKPAQEAFWGGYSGSFSDPDGFLWEVAWNPSFVIAEDGSIRIPD